MIEDKVSGKFKHKCPFCGDIYVSKRGNSGYCGSTECGIAKNRSKFFLDNLPDLSSGTVGAVSELCVSSFLLNLGYSVFRALSPSCYCDLIATKNGIIYEIEVRTGKKKKDTGKIFFQKTTHGNISCFGVYERIENKVYFFNSIGKEFSL